MNAKEIMQKYYLTKANYQSQDGSYFTVENIEVAIEEYASYKTKELEDKIQSFRELLYSKLAKEQNWDLGDIYLEFDKYFNTKEQ